MKAELIDYLSRRAGAIEAELEVVGDSSETTDSLYAEYLEVDDYVSWLELTCEPELTDENRASAVYRRYGTSQRLRPLIDELMADGLPRTTAEMLDSLEEPQRSAAAIGAILGDWEYKGFYRKVGHRDRRIVWVKNGAVYQAAKADPNGPAVLLGNDGSVYRLARD